MNESHLGDDNSELFGATQASDISSLIIPPHPPLYTPYLVTITTPKYLPQLPNSPKKAVSPQ